MTPKAKPTAKQAPSEDEALDALFREDFDSFVTRRNELVKALRAAGDGEGADRLRAVKKPSRVAWALNRLSAEEPKLRDRLLAAGADLREAQQRLMSGKGGAADVRAAGEAERKAVTEALAAARERAEGGLSEAAQEQARQTLHAVALDEDVRREFELHRLATDHQAAGMSGLLEGAGAKAAGPGKAATKSDTKGANRKRADREAAKRRREELEEAEKEVKRLERVEREAERDLQAAQKAAEKAQRQVERAEQAAGEAREATEEARQAAASLRDGSSG